MVKVATGTLIAGFIVVVGGVIPPGQIALVGWCRWHREKILNISLTSEAGGQLG